MRCRSCGGGSFGAVIDLGPMPLVNNLLKSPDDPCPRWPLKVVFCRGCSLAQLTETPPPELMFGEYLYFSSQSHTMVRHAGDLVKRFVKAGQRVVEIASNDGYLLAQAQQSGATVLGIDPAKNIVAHAVAAGVPTRCEYFDAEVARDIGNSWGHADVIFANNVLAHVPDPNEVAAGIKALLSRSGVAHIEVPSLTHLIQNAAFDTIYHEHQCYFSLTALKTLFNRHGLSVVQVEMIDIHGGSFHLQLMHHGDEIAADAIQRSERQSGILDDQFYAGFADRVGRLGEELRSTISRFDSTAACGAAAKGVILLNAFGLERTRVPWVSDVSPHKQNHYIPGTGQRIVHPQRLLDDMPEAAIILPWNIKDEIIERNAEYRRRGGRFIIPLPHVTVI